MRACCSSTRRWRRWRARDVDDFTVVEEIFCQLFAACEYAHDVDRADQWIRVGEDIAARRKLPAVAAFCRTHYGGLLTAAGRWGEADVALSDAVRIWGLGHSSLRPGALVRLADLRVRQGRFEEAEQLLDGLDGDVEAARPLAATISSEASTELAVGVLERALGRDRSRPASAAARCGRCSSMPTSLPAARPRRRDRRRRLDGCAAPTPGSYLLATAAMARGRLCLAETTGDPCVACARRCRASTKAQTPMELAQAHFELARALASEQPEVALAEARAALDGFERLRRLARPTPAAALMRSLGSRERPTRRTARRR